MKYITFEYDGKQQAGILSGDMKTAHPFSDAGIDAGSMLAFIERHTAEDVKRLKGIEGQPGIPVSEIRLMAPIPKPHHDVICLGLNYMDHVEESKSIDKANLSDMKREEAVYFSKRVIDAVGPEGVIKCHAAVTERLDYEAELAAVIGKDARGVKRENAWAYVFGLMCFNDVSAREIQMRHKQWYFGKSLDTFTAFGPYIVSADEFSFPLALSVQSRVNGEVRQSGNTKNMIFPIDYVIEELSAGMTLDAGSIIATGTPAGVGAGFDPPKFMKPGDVCEIEIEGCGVLRNTVAAD